jgi:hypothetical protein
MKRFYIILGIIFAVFVFLHFYNLSLQEFVGDEAGPMYLIDRMWDFIRLKDIRFLAFPYLFYYEPYRAIFSGTILHFFGSDRILLRLPSILFGFATFWFFVWAFLKEKVSKTIIVLSLLSYSVSGIIINDRSGGGDAQTRFFILVAAYFLWKAAKDLNRRKLRLGIAAFSSGLLTMLDTTVILPGLIYSLVINNFFRYRKTLILSIGMVIFFGIYFFAWLILPYLAYKANIQNYLDNRGLFYYFSNLKEGLTRDPGVPIYYMVRYSSVIMFAWFVVSFAISFFLKKNRTLLVFTLPAWIFGMVLSHSGMHIIMYFALFFFQSVLIADYFVKKYPRTKIIFFVLFIFVIIFNAANLYNSYYALLNIGKNSITVKKPCLDEAVIRIYKNHETVPLNKNCIYPRIQ